ncbi:MAG: SDR family oxidoreductase [Bacteriovoracaceae bacterium]|nr:SDR family oxidoreductase [Bacteriovoracaceae bacterium]
MKNNTFENKVVIVTGAASGIGRATALAFAREGAQVVVSDVREEEARETCRLIEQAEGSAFYIKCDVSLESDVKNMVEQTMKKFGRLDCAYNNAGIEGVPSSTMECSLDNWNHTIDINLKGVWLCMKYQIPIMLASGRGSIVNCSSIAGVIGFKTIPAYVASKHGVIGLTKTAALEYAQNYIRVNVVCPGVIHTPMLDRFTRGQEDAMGQLAPMGRVGQPEEIAESVLWLCSDQASYVTGLTLTVDGGWTAQ